MSKGASKSDSVFMRAMNEIQEGGGDPLDYALSFLMGWMDEGEITEYRAIFEDRVMLINLSKPGEHLKTVH